MDFDKIINRKDSNSLKWDGADRLLQKDSEKMWENTESIKLPKDFIPMWAADMDFKAPEEVLDTLQQRIEHGILGYCIRPNSYHEALRDWLFNRHQWKCDTNWMVYCPGVLPAINLAIDTFSDIGDNIVIQPPVYYRFSQAIEQNGRKTLRNPLIFYDGKYSMDFEHLEMLFKKGVKLLILCNPHNPIGQCWSLQTLQTLSNLCIKYNVIVISDEIHSDLVLEDNQHIPLASISEEIATLCITCLAPSKTFNIAGLRTATIIISDEFLRKKMKKTIARYGLDVSNVFGLIAFETAYKEGEKWLESLKKYLEGNVKLIQDFLQNREDISIVTPQATHMVWLDFRKLDLSSEVLKSKLIKEAHVGLSDGKTYFGQEAEGFQRMNIGCPKNVLQEALARIDKVV